MVCDHLFSNLESVNCKQKILVLLPTGDEIEKISEAQALAPGVPLANAENFLQTLASIWDVRARLELWLFRLNFDAIEHELVEPLADLSRGLDDLRRCATFAIVLATLLAFGNFLNGSTVRSFCLNNDVFRKCRVLCRKSHEEEYRAVHCKIK